MPRWVEALLYVLIVGGAFLLGSEAIVRLHGAIPLSDGAIGCFTIGTVLVAGDVGMRRWLLPEQDRYLVSFPLRRPRRFQRHYEPPVWVMGTFVLALGVLLSVISR
jgi:hypothetical protein